MPGFRVAGLAIPRVKTGETLKENALAIRQQANFYDKREELPQSRCPQ